MAAALNLAPQVPISKTIRELKELQVARQALITDQTRLLNRIKTQVIALVVQQGKARLKLINALYMPAIAAMRFNPDLKAKYQALRKAGKPAKVAITALMRKLIELARACPHLSQERAQTRWSAARKFLAVFS